MSTQFAVVDLETTGLHPGGHDRIIEIGIVRLDEQSRVVSEYETLVNPNRDLGPTWLHGIEARDLGEAPEFLDVCGDVVRMLRDSILVGHNVEFDVRFIEAEFGRVNHQIPVVPRIDTISMATHANPGLPNRRLEDVCACFGIEMTRAHCAMSDARATARLFAECLDRLGTDRVVDRFVRTFDSDPEWPTIPSVSPPYPRSRAIVEGRGAESFIASLVGKLAPSANDPPELHAYYSMLDRILEDRRISRKEAEALRETAEILGLSGAGVMAANTRYMRSLVETALRDDVLGLLEKRDLEEVARLLGLSATVRGLIREVEGRTTRSGGVEACKRPEVEGRSVCFTGSLQAMVNGERASRELASRIAESRGMVVKRGVTKKLDYLVVTDPESMSGKASKARKYGIRIVAEPVFWTWMGVDVQ